MRASVVDPGRRGLRLEYLSVAWSLLDEAAVAAGAGTAAHSIALVGFGVPRRDLRRPCGHVGA